MKRRNLGILMACQCLATAGAALVVTIGGIAGTALAPEPALATLPMSLMVVGTAATAVPAALLMRRVGRRLGFLLFCLATLLIGGKLAFSQQYRFAAAESVVLSRSGRAVSLVLLGAVGGAFLGPELATSTIPVADDPFIGAFLAVGAVFVVAALLLLLLSETAPVAAADVESAGRPLGAIARQPLFVIAVLGGVVGQGVMTFVMTATPISMHVLDGFTLAETAGVIRAHVLAMYVPSLASAMLIGWLGSGRLMTLGLAALVATLAIALQGHAYLHYWVSLVLLGIGWNFLFVGGTSLLVESYRPEERFTAQGANDFCVFGVAAAGSLLAGSVVHAAGWEAVLWGSMPLLALMAAALAWLTVLRRRQLPLRPAP